MENDFLKRMGTLLTAWWM